MFCGGGNHQKLSQTTVLDSSKGCDSAVVINLWVLVRVQPTYILEAGTG